MYQEYFSEDHQIFRSSVKKFVEREIRPWVDQWEEEESFPVELYHKAGAAGFLGMGYPEEYGGTEADIFMNIVFTEEMIRGGSVGLVAGLGSHSIGIPPVAKMGTEEQKRRFLTPVLKGEKISALGITEPNAGSDVANIRTRAVREGDFYRVNGAKTFITSGCRANFLTTAVRTGGEGFRGISLLMIDSSTEGYAVTKKIKKMGWHASDTAEISFTDCLVPGDNLIGEEGAGFYGIMLNFQAERLALAVMAHAVAQLALDESLEYAKRREVFGRPLTGFQVLRHKLVEMASRIEIAREYNYRVAARMEAGLDAVREVSMAKNFACEVCDQVVSEAVQIHGGYGYAREYLVERLYRDSRVLSIGGGTTEIMKEVIGKFLIRP
ncbi:MAG: acyl-CoA dehydrogenase family protein [Smithellaceae bacterium]|nr:acyl-CoA dehydrogenase family protein [Smithellaceae bacterium]